MLVGTHTGMCGSNLGDIIKLREVPKASVTNCAPKGGKMSALIPLYRGSRTRRARVMTSGIVKSRRIGELAGPSPVSSTKWIICS
jgi:hypothetical protein